MQVQFLGREDPLEKGMAAHSSILAWRTRGQRGLAGCGPWGCKSRKRLTQLNTYETYVCIMYVYYMCITLLLLFPTLHTVFNVRVCPVAQSCLTHDPHRL